MKCYHRVLLGNFLLVSLLNLTVSMDSVYIQDSYIDECFIYLFLSPNSSNNCYYSNK